MMAYDYKFSASAVRKFEQKLPPQVSFNYGQCGEDPLTYCFEGGAYDPDGGDILFMTWDLGDGRIASSLYNHIEHHYKKAGTYTVTLRCIDDENTMSSYSKTIHVG